MKNYYLDLSKICFGVGFYGCVSRIENPMLAILLAISSLVMVFVFVRMAKKEEEEQ